MKQTHKLEKQILDDQVERNRELNRAINKDYEEIGQRLECDIESTNDLIETIEYFKRLLEETRVWLIFLSLDLDHQEVKQGQILYF